MKQNIGLRHQVECKTLNYLFFSCKIKILNYLFEIMSKFKEITREREGKNIKINEKPIHYLLVASSLSHYC